MHLNSHTGRNVHTCPYCSIQFTSRQTYEGHLKSHTNTKESSIIKEDLDNSIVDHNAGPQIVSVKSIENFEDSLSKTEEIQIEPDIVNSSDDDDDLEDVEEIEDDIKFDSKRFVYKTLSSFQYLIYSYSIRYFLIFQKQHLHKGR